MKKTTGKNSISFIMPAYNCQNTVEAAMESIVDSNIEDSDEIIIVNDCSTDNTAAILKKLADKYHFIKVINHSENLGGGAARNTAARNSKNDLIFCLDSDNVLEKNSIEKLKNFLISSENDVCSFQELKFFKDDIKKITHSWKYKEGAVSILDMFSSPIVPPSSGNYLFTKKSWAAAGGYPEAAGALDTWGFGWKQLAAGVKMTPMPKSYYFHRVGHQSYWVRESKNKEKISLLAADIINLYPNAVPKKILDYVNDNKANWFYNIGNIPNIPRIKVGKAIQSFGLKSVTNLKKLIPSTMKMFIKKTIARLPEKFIVSHQAFQKFYRYLFKISLRGMNVGEGAVCGQSGESWVIEYIKSKTADKSSLTIFDVGANVGDYAQLCLKLIGEKKCDIYCFEPSAETFKTLSANAASLPSVKPVNIGIGEKTETRVLYSDKAGSGLASLHNRNLKHHKVGSLDLTESVSIKTIDQFCAEEKIDRVDLLKLDVEGNELSCLRGAKDMLARGKIDFIQFEFGGCNIDSRTYFQDFFYLLSPNYKIYRILGKGLFEIKRYDEIDEIFLTTNYLAERK